MLQRSVTAAMIIAITLPNVANALDLPRPPEPERRPGVFRHYTAHEIWHLQFDELSVVSRSMTSVREYDVYGRLVVETPRIADIRTTQAVYAAAMRLVAQTRYMYDEFDRVTEVRRVDSHSSGLTLYRYVEDASAVLQDDDSFDASGPGIVTVHWYDAHLNPLRISVFRGEEESQRQLFAYEHGMLTSIDTYDRAGRRTGRVRYRHTADSRSVVKEHYGQDGSLTRTERIETDDSGRVIRRKVEPAGDFPDHEMRYQYRDDGSYSIIVAHGDSEVVRHYTADGQPVDAHNRGDGSDVQTITQELQTEAGSLRMSVADTYVTKFGETYVESRTVTYDWTIPESDATWAMSGQAGFPNRSGHRTATRMIGFTALTSDGLRHAFDAEKLLEGTSNHMLMEYRAEPQQQWSVERTIEALLVDQMPPGVWVAVRIR